MFSCDIDINRLTKKAKKSRPREEYPVGKQPAKALKRGRTMGPDLWGLSANQINGNDQLRVGRGPGYPDEILSTKIIGERQFGKAVKLFSSTTNLRPAALGPGFAAGTTDGPGMFGFQQGDTEINEFWKQLRDLLKEPSKYQPAILPIQMLSLGNFVILSVPGGLTNTYSQYVATFEEYKQQRYEAASTLYGPRTLSAYIQEFTKLAKAMATGEMPAVVGLLPPDLSSVQISLLQDPLGDSPPPGKRFGDMEEDVAQPKGGSFKKGDKPRATFWSANPRNDLC
ncbi:putative Dehydrin 2 [Hibiscus syriacus]|uniref:ceramidase n=1 Tax=Hibiscus syriacus TaxID=106335 RepID=A0A6A3DAB6_HIBSY|nr:putative Dehydrin 2 [Hibiscus syriacus]